VRRFPAIVLLLVAFSLSLLTPLLLASAEQTNLPACCRRDGNHHCAKQMGKPAADGVQITALSVCPFFPAGKVTPAPVPLGIAPPVLNGIAASITVENAPAPPRVTRHSDAIIRPWQQRGPPSLVS
jgi:hypothetical protein